MTGTYAAEVGARLRQVRVQHGLTLHEVEVESEGRWRAVVLSSYERALRPITAQRLSELADFYDVPVRVLVPDVASAPVQAVDRIVLNRARLAQLPAARAPELLRYICSIQRQRGEHDTPVLTLRAGDVRGLAVLLNTSVAGVYAALHDLGLLAPPARDRGEHAATTVTVDGTTRWTGRSDTSGATRREDTIRWSAPVPRVERKESCDAGSWLCTAPARTV